VLIFLREVLSDTTLDEVAVTAGLGPLESVNQWPSKRAKRRHLASGAYTVERAEGRDPPPRLPTRPTEQVLVGKGSCAPLLRPGGTSMSWSPCSPSDVPPYPCPPIPLEYQGPRRREPASLLASIFPPRPHQLWSLARIIPTGININHLHNPIRNIRACGGNVQASR